MPRLDGTGPYGTGYPGRGSGPCGRKHGDASGSGRMHHHFRKHQNGHNCVMNEAENAGIYNYTAIELQERKANLEKEIQWVEARINELGEQNENSPSSN